MNEIINFRKARKQAVREKESKLAAENRQRFGRTKTQRQKEEADKEKVKTILDQHRLEREGNP